MASNAPASTSASASPATVRAGPSQTSIPSAATAPAPTVPAPTRSERMLRDMLQKDGAARSRSLSRGSSSAAGIPQYVPSGPAPPLPTSPAMVPSLSAAAARVLEESATQRQPRPLTVSRNSSDQSLTSSTEERPLFAANGPGGPGLLLRPTLPAPRKTHDGVIPQKSPPPSLPHHPGHAQMARHQTAPPASLNHTETSPLPTSPFKNAHNVHQPVARPYAHTQLPAWSYEGGESSSPTSYSPQSDNMGLSSGRSSGSPSGSSSGVSSTQQPCTPSPYPGSAFDLQSANEFCRQQSGYISFGDIQGLGRPFEDEEDERLERERLEAEQRKKRGFWGWIEDATHTSMNMGGLVSRPKTPALAQHA